MANLGGFQLKNIKRTLGMEGYGCTANMYLDGEKIGAYADYGDGAMGDWSYVSKEAEMKMDSFLLQYAEAHPNDYIVNLYQQRPEQRKEEYERFVQCHPHIKPEYVTDNVLSNFDMDCLVYDFTELNDNEKEYKKALKKGYGAIAVLKDQRNLNVTYSIPQGWTDEKIKAELLKVHGVAKDAKGNDLNETFPIYRELSDFDIPKEKCLHLIEAEREQEEFER